MRHLPFRIAVPSQPDPRHRSGGTGQTLASSTLDGGAASVPGAFAFTAPATAPPVGTATHSVTITPGTSSDLVEVIIPTPGDNCFIRFKVSQ